MTPEVGGNVCCMRLRAAMRALAAIECAAFAPKQALAQRKRVTHRFIDGIFRCSINTVYPPRRFEFCLSNNIPVQNFSTQTNLHPHRHLPIQIPDTRPVKLSISAFKASLRAMHHLPHKMQYRALQAISQIYKNSKRDC